LWADSTKKNRQTNKVEEEAEREKNETLNRGERRKEKDSKRDWGFSVRGATRGTE